jgi:teichuronic acid exporter
MTTTKNLGEAIRGGTKWFLVGSLGNQVLQFGFGVVLARLLVPADFGMLVTIQIFTGLVGFIAGGGMGQALVQAKAVEEHHFHVVFTLQFAAGVLIYATFFIIAPWFANWFGVPLYRDLLRVSALTFLLRPFANVPNARLTREMRFQAQAINSFVSMLATGALSIFMAARGMGVWSLMLSGIAGSTLGIIIVLSVTRWRPRFAYDPKATRRLGIYGLKVSANDIVVYLRYQTSSFIISRFAGPALVGLYNKADSLSTLPVKFVSYTAYQPMLRALAKVQDNKDQSRYMYFRALTLVTVYALPFVVGLWWVAKPFVMVVYGEKWLPAVAPMQVLLFAAIFHCIDNQSGAVSAAQNKLGKELFIQLESWVLVGIICLATVRHGIIAMAWGTAMIYAYTSLRMAVLAMRSLGATVTGFLGALRPALLLNGVLFAFLGIVDWAYFGALRDDRPAIYLAGMAVLGAIVYGAMFLYAPVAALNGEAMRWKRALRLVR